MQYQEIGRRIRALRKQRGDTLQEVAYQLGVSQGTLWRCEVGQSAPRIDTLIAIAQHYGVTSDHILGLDDAA